ncbi:MAG: hypothetical protein K8L97_20305 [Anaerolineae bacterium]|nr:hypothetical protein [Anaerolineae bacterium]
MSEKPKRKPKEKPKRGAAPAPIEFIAPFPLYTCLEQLYSPEMQQKTVVIVNAFDLVTAENGEACGFRMQTKQRNSRAGSMHVSVELRGYLKPLSDNSTLVLAESRLNIGAIIVLGFLLLMLTCSLFSIGEQVLLGIFVWGTGLFLLGGWLLVQRMNLIQSLRHALHAEVGEAHLQNG